jgi:hypothetical protein
MTGRIKRRQHLITLDDLGDRVRWELEDDDSGVIAAGNVPLSDFNTNAGSASPLDRAFAEAWTAANRVRVERATKE